MSWYLFNPTYEQSGLVSSIRVLDNSIFAGLRWAAGENIYDFTYDPQVNGPFIYPPLFAFIGFLASKVNYAVSHLSWFGVVTFSYFIFLILGFKYLVGRTRKIWQGVSFGVIGALSQLALGQLNYGHYYMFFPVIIFGIFLSSRLWVISLLGGLGLGLSLYMLLFLPFIYLKGGLKAVTYSLGIGVLLHLPLLFNLQSAWSYPGFLIKLNQVFMDAGAPFFRVRGFLYDLNPLVDLVYFGLMVTFLIIVYLTFMAKPKINDLPKILSFHVALALLIDPLFSDHHLPLIFVIYLLNFPNPRFFLVFPFLFLLNDINLNLYNHDPKWFGWYVNQSLRQIGVIGAFIYTLIAVKEYININKAIKQANLLKNTKLKELWNQKPLKE